MSFSTSVSTPVAALDTNLPARSVCVFFQNQHQRREADPWWRGQAAVHPVLCSFYYTWVIVNLSDLAGTPLTEQATQTAGWQGLLWGWLADSLPRLAKQHISKGKEAECVCECLGWSGAHRELEVFQTTKSIFYRNVHCALNLWWDKSLVYRHRHLPCIEMFPANISQQALPEGASASNLSVSPDIQTIDWLTWELRLCHAQCLRMPLKKVNITYFSNVAFVSLAWLACWVLFIFFISGPASMVKKK